MPLATITVSRAIERSLLADRLRAVDAGDTVTYDELSLVCKLDVRGAGKHALRAARMDVLDDDRLVFEAAPNVGLRRLMDSDLATERPESRRQRIYRQSRLALREMNAATLSALTDGERQQFNARFAHLSALAVVATHRALKRVMSFTPDSPNLPVEETLAKLSGIK